MVPHKYSIAPHSPYCTTRKNTFFFPRQYDDCHAISRYLSPRHGIVVSLRHKRKTVNLSPLTSPFKSHKKKEEDPASQRSPLYVCLEFVLENVLNLFDYASAGASVVSVSAVSAASASAFAAASAAFLSATF